MLVDGKLVSTNKGVMQGAVTSPITFALYIDDMLRALNVTSTTYALADDLICICKGDMELYRTVKTLNKFCKDLDLGINQSKSAILIVKHRNTKKETNPKSILGFPVLRSYKYLGVRIDDMLSFNTEHQHKM